MTNPHAVARLLVGAWVGAGAQASERRQIIDPQANINIVLGHQLARQTKCHADVAKVIHNRAENIPRGFHPGSSWMSKSANCPS
jgi:hypothetical protein